MHDRDIEKYTKDHMSVDHSFEETLVKYRRKKVLECMTQHAAKNILEIGCGMDSVCNYYDNFETFTIVEPSKEFLENAVHREGNIVCVHAFLEDKIETLSTRNYDFIILSSLLHEVADSDMFLKTVKKLCGKDTVVHINVPNAKSFHLLWAYKSGLIPKLGSLTETAKHFQQHNVFDLDSLSQKISESGYLIMESGSYFIKPFNHTKMAQACQYGLIDSALLDGLYALVEYMPDCGAEIFVNCKVRE